MITYKNRLPVSLLVGYIRPAPHKAGAGIGTPQAIRAHNRASGFFTCKASSRLFHIMAGRAGESQGSPGSLVAGSSNPVRLATQSLEPLAGELSQFTTRGYPSWQTVSTPALTLSASTRRPKLTAVSTAPAHWQHTYRFALIICRQICPCTGYHPSWTTLQTICWSCSSLLTPQNEQTKKPHHLKYCLRSACWWGAHDSAIQEAG